MKNIMAPTLALPLSALLAAAVSLACANARAADAPAPQDQTITADAAAKDLNQVWRIANDASIEIHNVRGRVVVNAADQDRASLSGSLGAGSKLVVSGDALHLQLHVEAVTATHGLLGGSNNPGADSDLILGVPRGVALTVDLVSADGKISGVEGKSLAVNAVSGDVNLASGAAEVDVQSVSGDVLLEVAHANANRRVHLQTVSGNIDAKGPGARIKLETVSGQIHLTTAQAQEIEASAVSGDIEIVAALAAHGRMQLETMSGDVHAKVPAALSANITAETFSGGIRSDFGTVKKQEYGPGSSLEVRNGDGDAQITLKSFSGSVDIHKQ